MNKADLIARVSETTGLPKATTEVAVNTIFTVITDSLAQGDSIAIAGFGTFNVKSREARNQLGLIESGKTLYAERARELLKQLDDGEVKQLPDAAAG